jgi:hypothetical protein
LLNQLAQLPTDQWLSTASWIACVEQSHRYFLIPEKPQVKNKWDPRQGRYDNFREGEPHKSQTAIEPSAPDAFARVEGRYIERFLEWVPSVLGYVDVGYARRIPQKFPQLGGIPAFRVHERLRRALTGKIAEPIVRVTPAFEVYAQSEFYPARVTSQLNRIGELASADTAVVYRLTKKKVAAAQAADPKLDPIKLLESVSSSPLPENVRRELAGWSEHSEKFVLYKGFSLLETEVDVPVPVQFQQETIAPGTYIVRSPEKVFAELERQERMPIQVAHGPSKFSALPGARSSVAGTTRKPAKTATQRPKVTLMKIKRVQLLCPDPEFLQRLTSALLGAGCPAEADGKNLSLVYSDQYEAEVGKVIRGLSSDFQVTIENKS